MHMTDDRQVEARSVGAQQLGDIVEQRPVLAKHRCIRLPVGAADDRMGLGARSLTVVAAPCKDKCVRQAGHINGHRQRAVAVCRAGKA